MNRQIRLVPAVLLALAVLLVAVAGSATAAAMITGKQIKDGTVTTADIKNGSLTRADLRPQSRTTVVGVANDATGIDVPSCSDTTLADCPALLTLPVAPGSQLVTASGTIDNLAAGVPAISNRCGLVQGGEELVEVRLALAANGQPGEIESFALQQVITVPDASQPVSLRCTEMAGESLRVAEPRISAVRSGF